jgi:hypothetical protein
VPPEVLPRLSPEPLDGPLPAIRWRWDAETDILSGSFRGERSGGLDGAIELTDAEGAVVVIDIADGAIAGVDVVVWPEVATARSLPLPEGAKPARLVLAQPRRMRGALSYEVETELTLRSTPAEHTYHLAVGEGELEVGRTIRVADNLWVELDEDAGLVGLWLAGVPPFPSLDSADS